MLLPVRLHEQEEAVAVRQLVGLVARARTLNGELREHGHDPCGGAVLPGIVPSRTQERTVCYAQRCARKIAQRIEITSL